MLTLAQAAKLLSLSPGYLRVAIHRGLLSASKKGRDWQISTIEAERFRDHRNRSHAPNSTSQDSKETQ